MPLLQEFQEYKAKGVLTEEKPESTTEKKPSQEFEQYKREQEGETFISTDKPSFTERVINPLLENIGLRKTTGRRIAKSQLVNIEAQAETKKYVDNVMSEKAEQMSQETGIDIDTIKQELEPHRELVETEVFNQFFPNIEKNFDNYIFDKYGVMTPAKAGQQMAKTVIGGYLAIGAAAIPITAAGAVALIKGVGTYAGVKQVLGRTVYKYVYQKVHKEPYYKNMVDNISELLPEETAQGVKDMVDILEFVGIAKIAGALQSPKAKAKYGEWFEKATKDMITETKLPKSVYISANKVKDLFQTGTKISAYEKDILSSAGLTGTQYKLAMKTGAKLEIPAEKIIKLVDKPYWARIKGLFSLKPTTEVRILKDGEVLFNSDLTAKVKGATIQIKPIAYLDKGITPTTEGKGIKGKATKYKTVTDFIIENYGGVNTKKMTASGWSFKDIKENGLLRAMRSKGGEAPDIIAQDLFSQYPELAPPNNIHADEHLKFLMESKAKMPDSMDLKENVIIEKQAEEYYEREAERQADELGISKEEFNRISQEAFETASAGVQADVSEPGEVKTPQEVKSRLDKLKTSSQIKREATKKATQEAMEEVKDIGEAKSNLIEKIRQRRFDLSLAAYETNLFVNEIDRALPKAQREVIPFIIEKTDIPKGLNRPDLEAIYNRDKELLTPIADKVRQHFDEGWVKIKEHTPDLTANEIENYVTHIWDIPKNKRPAISNWFTTQNKFLKKRYIETLKEGIEKFELKPKTLDISEIIKIHDTITNRAIENAKLVNWLSTLKTTDGTPLLAPSHQAPDDWEAIYHPALQKKIFIPGEEKLGEKITPELQDILTEMGVAIGRRISPMAFGKPVQIAGQYKYGIEPSEVRFKRFFSSKTSAHEIGHHLDKTLKLGEPFIKRYKDELYAINKDRINKFKGATGKYNQEYAESTEEQIAEFFALLFNDATKSMQLAPGATTEILAKLNNDETLTKLVNFDFATRAKLTIGESVGTLVSVPLKAHPELANALRVIFDTPFRHPLISTYESLNMYLKKSSLTLSLFHPTALTEAGIAMSGLKPFKLLNPVKIYKAIVKNELPVYEDVPLAKEWIRAGLQMGATKDIPVARIQKNLNDLATKTKNIPLINKMTEYTAMANEGWDRLLWDYYQSSLKLYACQSLGQYIDPAQDITKQKREIAQVVNDTFGGQNWDVLMMSPKSVQLLTWGLLSADWTISALIRQPLAPTGVGNLYDETIKLRRKIGTMFWLKAFLYFGVGMNLLNAVMRKRDYKKNPQYYEGQEPQNIWDYTMAGNVIGKKTYLFAGRYADGSERYLRWGKQFREIPEMIFDDFSISPISASLKKVGGKTAPVIQQVSTILTGVSPSGYTQREIYEKEGWDRVLGTLKVIAKSPVPFSLRNSLQADKEFMITDLAMPSSKGISRYKAIEYFKIGIKKYQKSGDERIIKEVYQDALRNNLNAYGLFNVAMATIKAEEIQNINTLNRDLKDVEQSLAKETDPKIRKVLTRRKVRMIKDIKEIEKGVELFDNALKKLEAETENR